MVTQLRGGSIEFRFYRPNAQRVSLAGDFTGWQNLPMTRGPDGWWRCLIRAAPGCYHFRYLCDNEWFLDYAAFGLEHGPYGLNSVVSVESPSPAVASLSLLRGGGIRTENRCATGRSALTSPTTASAPRGGGMALAAGA